MHWKFIKRKSEMTKCACGCGQEFDMYDCRNRIRKYVVGHIGKVNGLGKIPHKIWNKGTSGICKANKGTFQKGRQTWNKGLEGFMAGEKNPWFGKFGRLHPVWKGLTPELELIRKGKPYLRWRREVLKRDGNKCISCGVTQNLQVDHIKPFITFPKERFNLNNGRVLCFPCHKKTETYGIKARSYICVS